jgi:hypothetical protein
MGLTWTISHDEKLVVIRVRGEITPDALRNMFMAFAAEGLLPYRKLLDATFAPLSLNVAVIGTLSRIAGIVAPEVRRGPVAFVASSDVADEMIQIFDHKLSIDRPLRLFRNIKAAMQWLDEIAPLDGS